MLTGFSVSDNSNVDQVLANDKVKKTLSRLSPTFLYEEAVVTIMNPSVRTLGPILLSQAVGLSRALFLLRKVYC